MKYQDRLAAHAKGKAKLTVEDVIIVKCRLANGETPRVIAQSFGLSTETIRKIARGESWAWLIPEQGECVKISLAPKWPCACGAFRAEDCPNPKPQLSEKEMQERIDASLRVLEEKLKESTK